MMKEAPLLVAAFMLAFAAAYVGTRSGEGELPRGIGEIACDLASADDTDATSADRSLSFGTRAAAMESAIVYRRRAADRLAAE
jgi:hypothetical protein